VGQQVGVAGTGGDALSDSDCHAVSFGEELVEDSEERDRVGSDRVELSTALGKVKPDIPSSRSSDYQFYWIFRCVDLHICLILTSSSTYIS
jgi:hypothetical protein